MEFHLRRSSGRIGVHMDADEIQRAIEEYQPADAPPPSAEPAGADEVARLARRVWPDGLLPASRAAWFCDLFGAIAPNNRTILYFEPKIKTEDGIVRVGGATNALAMRDTPARALHAAGISEVRGEMRLLPEEGRLKGCVLGICAATAALTYDRPTANGTPQTQLVRDEPVFLLDHDLATDCYLLHAADGYWGWVRSDAIRAASAEEFQARIDAWRGPTPHEPSRPTVSEPDRDRASTGGIRAAMRALQLLRKPYLFGGVSPAGLDCSGLVRWAWEWTISARDACQQFPSGKLVATRWRPEGIHAGDLLYFVNACGRIHHVAIGLNETHYIHAASPFVRINSLKEGDRLYDAERTATFFAAKRIV